MKNVKIYHGSMIAVKNPIFGYGNKNNDYGLGFYCTFSLNLAKEWANRSGAFGYASEYDLDISNLKILDLTENNFNVLNWIALLLKNRKISKKFKIDFKDRIEFINKFYIDVDSYDVIIGYRADDAYFRFPIDFIAGETSMEQLNHAFKLGLLGKQIVLKSKKAFNKIKFIKAHETNLIDKDSYKKRMEKASEQYAKLTYKRDKGVFIYDFMDKSYVN